MLRSSTSSGGGNAPESISSALSSLVSDVAGGGAGAGALAALAGNPSGSNESRRSHSGGPGGIDRAALLAAVQQAAAGGEGLAHAASAPPPLGRGAALALLLWLCAQALQDEVQWIPAQLALAPRHFTSTGSCERIVLLILHMPTWRCLCPASLHVLVRSGCAAQTGVHVCAGTQAGACRQS